MERGRKKTTTLNDFKFGTFIGQFPRVSKHGSEKVNQTIQNNAGFQCKQLFQETNKWHTSKQWLALSLFLHKQSTQMVKKNAAFNPFTVWSVKVFKVTSIISQSQTPESKQLITLCVWIRGSCETIRNPIYTLYSLLHLVLHLFLHLLCWQCHVNPLQCRIALQHLQHCTAQCSTIHRSQ